MSLIRYLKFFFKNNDLKLSYNYARKLDDMKFGHLVGTDSLGNKYYENSEERYSRHRWVLPSAKVSDSDATLIPPGWHQWQHCTTNATPANATDNPDYIWMPKKHVGNLTGSPKAYLTFNTVAPRISKWEPAVKQR
ncbi:NADH dehydrogenase [ubiquinone] 1 alpha subcomplex subunit 12 [Zancudomyces culisetae]|uniref:NADH dehydrogenase [ubiquinone] 1 alpha subcomplex subunit n=1 Tax=Zancudomyces culisetae TaxID=1213189 RepID=A0A1R1PG89_ZANCU|nr:NADH dehydrogenase [ubiquinone] 1 alpha subcomplex subunit 12 [Zancudomyces culisetae]|eukprot:OMH79991.1 NADH dehydrogenase [ubiquinone] 1 alpha subcomplex subunit 12 [Zancudomyces culisetae]